MRVLLVTAAGAQPSAGWRIDTFAGLPDIRDKGLAIDARLARISSRGTELERMVAQNREVWPGVKIMLRGDSVFCRDELLSCAKRIRWSTRWDWLATSGCGH